MKQRKPQKKVEMIVEDDSRGLKKKPSLFFSSNTGRLFRSGLLRRI